MADKKKMLPCCGRRQAKLVMDQSALRTLAQRAAARQAKGLSIVNLMEKIDDMKTTIELDKEAIVEHEANHAGGGL